MSVNFRWEIIKADKAKTFAAGTSSEVSVLRETFGDTISSAQIPVLRAMHRATNREESLWSEIADTLERLGGEDMDDVQIKVWPEY